MQHAISAALREVNPTYVVVSAVTQVILAVVWYGCIVKHLNDYYYAADKGVRRPEHAIRHYHQGVVVFMTFASALLRAVTVTVTVAIFKGTTVADYQCAAFTVAILFMGSMHRYFGQQRPIQLIVTNAGYEVCAAMLAAMSCYGMKVAGI